MAQTALDALLGASTEIEDSVFIKRLGVEFTVKSLSTHEISELRAQATRPGRKGKPEVVDNELLSNLMIVASCVNPDFSDPKLIAHYEASDAADCLQKALLPGEVAALAQAVMEVSGFDVDEVEAAKN